MNIPTEPEPAAAATTVPVPAAPTPEPSTTSRHGRPENEESAAPSQESDGTAHENGRPPESSPTRQQPDGPGAHELADTDRVPVAELIAALSGPEESAQATPQPAGASRQEPAKDPTESQEPSDTATADQTTPGSVPPAVLAAKLTLTSKTGPVFVDVDLLVRPGTVAAVVGPRGSGRSCFLLAVSGRLAYTSGAVAVAGIHVPKQIRQQAAVARIDPIVELEDALTVAESVSERCLTEGVRPAAGRRRFAEAARLLALNVPTDSRVDELSAPDQARLAVALACVRPAHLVVLDDLDRECSTTDQIELLRDLSVLAAQGPAVLVSTVDPEPIESLGLTSVALVRHTEDWPAQQADDGDRLADDASAAGPEGIQHQDRRPAPVE